MKDLKATVLDWYILLRYPEERKARRAIRRAQAAMKRKPAVIRRTRPAARKPPPITRDDA